MTTAEEMAELVVLWSMLQEVQLTNRPDEIKWRWTSHGAYTAKSAYQAQFFGSYFSFDGKAIWKSKTEDKHHFFAWLLLQCKLLTADKLLKRNWPCNPLCPLCNEQEETAEHMCLHCVFSQEVWLLVSEWTGGRLKIPAPGTTMQDWWNNSLKGLRKKEKQQVASLLIYTSECVEGKE
jgi:hypothetical protein